MALIEQGDVGLRLQFVEPEEVSLSGLSSVLYDFNLLYDWATLVSVPD